MWLRWIDETYCKSPVNHTQFSFMQTKHENHQNENIEDRGYDGNDKKERIAFDFVSNWFFHSVFPTSHYDPC